MDGASDGQEFPSVVAGREYCRDWDERKRRAEHGANELASSQSTAKTVAIDGAWGGLGTYGTLPRVSAKADENDEGAGHPGQYCTLRQAGARRAPQSPSGAEAMGPRLAKAVRATKPPAVEDHQPEANRSLLYEQNMCTFENFCELRNSEHGPERLRSGGERETGPRGNTGGEGVANFCTLRSGRRGWRSATEGSPGPLGGDYCTLKRKKLQLNRQFVESFLEDPNAQVADYLSELDAYLDEMDGMDDDDDEDADVSIGHDGAGESVTSDPERSNGHVLNDEERRAERRPTATGDPTPPLGASEEGAVCSQSLQYYQPTADVRCGLGAEGRRCAAEDYQEDRIRFGDIKHFCTLPKQKRTQFLNAFKRGASLRRTFVAGTSASESDRPETDDRNVPAAGNDRVRMNDFNGVASVPAGNLASGVSQSVRSGNAGTHDHPEEQQQEQQDPQELLEPHGRLRNHHPTWHRHSMRRQHLIELPEQQEERPEAPLVLPSGADDGEDVSEDAIELSSISTLPVGEVPVAISTHPEAHSNEGPPTALVVALPPSPVATPVHMDRTDRDLLIVHASAPPPPLETDFDEERLVEARPRQTGRRSLSQPRIGSITVERDEATNELIIRTSSVAENADARFSSEPRQQQPPPHDRHRYGAPESEEGSSLGSSRNPSPVSILSSTTTTYSSFASATAENVEDRTNQIRHSTEQPASGTETTGTEALRGEGAGLGGGAAQEVATISYNSSSRNSRRNGTPVAATGRQQRQSNGGTIPVGSSAGPDGQPDEDESEMETAAARRSSRRNDGRPKARWPHAISRPLATAFCTLGLFNISRFAVFSVHFGANFVVQFLILSVFFGIPMMWLQMVLGARIRGGPVTMWRVSPICKGIGIALLLAQALVALYSAISLAWVLVYFRDAFITHNEKYRWQERFEAYRGAGQGNQSYRLPDTVADYFNGVVLQRYHLIYQPGLSGGPFEGGSRALPRVISGIGAIRFQLAFNMAIVWTLVFVALCRGIRSLGKVVIGLFLLALPALVAACAKLLTFINYDSVQSVFPATNWQEFFLNPISWSCAAQETFLTWGLLGVSTYALNCRSNRKGSCNARTKRELRRDAFLVALVTIVGLLLAAVLGSACVQILSSRGYFYSPGSYENLGTNVFLRTGNQPISSQHSFMNPNRWFMRYSTVVGESFKRTREETESGYQVLRLATELLPAALAAASPERIQPIWGLLAYLALLLFGVGQLCVMWKPIAGAIGDAPSSILLGCVTGLLLGMPLATEGGINIVHYLDTILGAAWWLLLLWIGHILALFLVRGRPFTSDILVNDLQLLQTFAAFVAFAWNFLLPIGLIFLCIIQYRLSNSAALFNWPSASTSAGTSGSGATGSVGLASAYWPLWARQVGGFVQVSFLLLVPIVMVVQIYRYLCSGPPDILDRVDLLLRPSVDGETTSARIRNANNARRAGGSTALQPSSGSSRAGTRNNTSSAGQRNGSPDRAASLALDSRAMARDAEDAPPKYTPPPSYTTATGARIAKLLRNSIRRSVRRIIGESSGASSATGGGVGFTRQRAALPQTTVLMTGEEQCDHALRANRASGGELPPPDYCSVLQQFGGLQASVTDGISMALESVGRPPRALYNSSTLGSGRRYRSLIAGTPQEQQSPSSLTASDVRQILRPTTIATGSATATTPAPTAGFTQTLRHTLQLRRGHSMENLVLAAAPIGDSSIITLNCDDHEPGDLMAHPSANGRDSVI